MSNKRVNLTVRPVTVRACARPAPGQPAGYAQHYAIKLKGSENAHIQVESL
jgi:hypothetical protein